MTAEPAPEAGGIDAGRRAATPHPLPLALCYHKVERRRELGVTRLSPIRFSRQIERLAASGYRTLTLSDLTRIVSGHQTPSEHEVLLTFDDAYRGLRDHAFPVLEAHGFTAVCSVITDYAGRLNRWDVAYGGRRFAHLSWRDIRRWEGRGIEFVSHTATHPRLTWLAERDVVSELSRSSRELHSRLGVRPTTIAFPFGAARSRERRIARDEGYTIGLELAGRWSGDPLAIPRLPVYPWAATIPGRGIMSGIEFAAAIVANRCAIGTTLWRSRRQSELGSSAPMPLAAAE
ncbi:MAG: hypothetical protein NVS1B4_19830 [Gemmatimonadaceae bacterium]